jgi:tripartite-type tricarboxylate transporter receptor subunit TctC
MTVGLTRRLVWFAALLVFGAVAPAQAQGYPVRPIKAIVPLSAGGTSDIFIRALGEELRKRWGQPLIVENRPGGNTNIAGKACAEAPPDGYTICILPGETLAFNRFQYKKLAYDAEKDFAPISNLFYSLPALVVSGEEAAHVIAEPDFRQRHMIDRGLAPIGETQAAFAAFLARYRVAAELVIKESGVEPQ